MVIKKTIKKSKNKINITIRESNDAPMDLNQITKYAEGLLKQYHLKDKSVYIRGLGQLGFATLKSLDRPLASINTDEEDYLQGRVKSNTKFDHFYKVEFTLFTK